VLGRWFGGQEVGVSSASATSTQVGTSLYVHI